MNEFFAALFELGKFLYFDEFSDDLFNHNIYITVGLVSLFFPLIMMGVYYYVWDPVRKNRWYHWFLFMLLVSFLVGLFTFLYTKSVFNFEGLEYYFHNFLTFALVIFIYNMLFFFLFSSIFKWWSTNNRRNPF